MALSFNYASNDLMRFGDYKGKKLGEIGETADGLLWLDALVARDESKGFLHGHTRECLRVYLTEPAIAARLRQAIEERDGD